MQSVMGKSQQDLPLEELQHFLFKVHNRNAKKMCEILSITSLTGNYNKLTSKLIMKKSKWRRWRRSGIFIDNFEHISHLFSSVSTVEFEHVNVCWVLDLKIKITYSKSLTQNHLLKLTICKTIFLSLLNIRHICRAVRTTKQLSLKFCT